MGCCWEVQPINQVGNVPRKEYTSTHPAASSCRGSPQCLVHTLQLAVHEGFAAHQKSVIAAGITVNILPSGVNREHVAFIKYFIK